MTVSWLPSLVLFEDSGNVWNVYVEVLYQWFRKDFVESKPYFSGIRVGLKRYPLNQGKEATFWHFISEGDIEEDRNINIRRCERIRWPSPIMRAFSNCKPNHGDAIIWWKSKRRNEWRYVLALSDFSYLFVVADRGEYVLPWASYCIDRKHRREKLRKEFENYWGV